MAEVMAYFDIQVSIVDWKRLILSRQIRNMEFHVSHSGNESLGRYWELATILQ